MKNLLAVSVMALAGFSVLSTKPYAQESVPAQATRPLVLTEAIPLEGVKGRIDHFGSAGNRLLISALGNNTVEVIDISARTVLHTISGIPNPQGVVFSPEANKLFAASSKDFGEVRTESPPGPTTCGGGLNCGALLVIDGPVACYQCDP